MNGITCTINCDVSICHSWPLFIYLFYLFIHFCSGKWIHNLPQRWIYGIILYGKQMIHTVFHLVVSEEMNTYIPRGGHFEFYARWPPEIDHNLFAMVFETIMPIPTTMPNLKNLAPSARFIWIPPPLSGLSRSCMVWEDVSCFIR